MPHCTRLVGLALYASFLLALPQAAAATGESCGLFSPCQHSHDYCGFVSIFSSICFERGDGRESCTGLGQGTCKNGLVCDFLGECRHEPGLIGERCGLGVPCAPGLNCSTAVGGRCEPPDQAGEACFGIGQGTCANGLICDFIGECRHVPSLAGEPCGLGVPCAPEFGCSADIGGICEARDQSGEVCSGTGQGSCEAGLLCDLFRTCRHPVPVLGESCGAHAPCAEGLFCQGGTQTCREFKTIGEGCSIFNPCEDGLACEPCLFDGCNFPLQCFPNANDGAISQQACLALYSPALHQAARDLGATTTFGSGNGVSAGVAENQEFGVAYGQDEYGCYTTFCAGADLDLELTAGFFSVGVFDDFDSVGGSSTAIVEEVEIVGVLNFSTAQIFERFSADPFDLGRFIGSQNCGSLGISPDLIPVSVGTYACETVLDVVIGAPPVCGDGVREGGEACDDGNPNNGDGCSSACTVEVLCGNGRRDPGEQCDDGNMVSGDGCGAMCEIQPFCGDGNLDPGEQCDDGNATSGDGCSLVCDIEAECGNGLVEPGEVCDDGNQVDTDGCSAFCEEEDADQDGIVDFADNCRLVPNPGQEDVNASEDDDSSIPGVQHYGDACDLDLDDDGWVGPSDFFAVYRPCIGARVAEAPHCGAADRDADGIVAASDFFAGLRPGLGGTPGPGVTPR